MRLELTTFGTTNRHSNQLSYFRHKMRSFYKIYILLSRKILISFKSSKKPALWIVSVFVTLGNVAEFASFLQCFVAKVVMLGVINNEFLGIFCRQIKHFEFCFVAQTFTFDVFK